MRHILNKNHLSNYLLLLLLILIFWNWWLPGVRVANDFPMISNKTLTEYFSVPFVWYTSGSSGLGEYGVFTLWSWQQGLLLGLLAKIGLDLSVQERLVFIIPIIVVGIMGIKKLLKKYEIQESGIFLSTFFYLTTTYLLLLIDGGQLSIALVYSLFPLVYIFLLDAINGNLRDKLISILLLLLISTLDVRFLFVLLLLLFLRFVFMIFNEQGDGKLRLFRSWFLSGVLFGLFWFLLNLYWLLPMLRFPVSSSNFSLLTRNIGVQPTTWKHAVLLLQPQWYRNVFGAVPPINYAFILIPAIAFFATVIVFISKFVPKFKIPIRELHQEKEVIFWTIVAFVGIFLTKGLNPPFGEVYGFLFAKIPGFSLFRDSTKFFFLVALSYSVLIAFSVDYLIRKYNPIIKINKLKIRVIPAILVVYLLFLVSPVWLGKMTGMFSRPVYGNEFKRLWTIFDKDETFSRILWLPSIPPLGYLNTTHPALEGLRLLNSRPFIIGTVGVYEQLNFLREASFVGELLKVAGVKYLIYSYPDTRRVEMKKDNIDYYYAFLDQLANLPWMEKSMSDPPVPLLQTKETKDHLFITNNSLYIVGSDRIYWDLMKIDGFDLSNNAFIFAEEQPGLVNKIDKNSKIILYDKGNTDLLMSFVYNDNFYFPAKDLERDPSASSGQEAWWKRDASDLVWWRDFLQTKYGIDNLDFDYNGGWAVGEGNVQLKITNDKWKKGEILYARVMKSNRSDKVEFWQGKEKMGELITQNRDPGKVDIKLSGYKDIPDKITTYNKADFNWFKVGEVVSSSEPITIKSFGDINVINAITISTESELNSIASVIQELKNENRVIYWEDLSDIDKQKLFSRSLNNKLTYRRVNPTKYEIEIADLNIPSYLIFSETYNQLWELNGQPAKPVYSLVNGFYVDEPGNYTLFFTPQKSVYPGLAISGVTVFIIIGFLIYPKLRKMYN